MSCLAQLANIVVCIGEVLRVQGFGLCSRGKEGTRHPLSVTKGACAKKEGIMGGEGRYERKGRDQSRVDKGLS